MESVELTRTNDGFTLVVRPEGWRAQGVFLLLAAVSFYVAFVFAHALLHGFQINGRPAKPIEVLYSMPLWGAGLTFVAVAIQRAFRTTVFTAKGTALVIATSGPLRRTRREFLRRSLQAAMVGDSQTSVNGRNLRQLQLHFAGETAPYRLLTNRDGDDLKRIAQYLTETLESPVKPFSREQFMEVRHADIHENLFKIMCGAGMAVILIAVAGIKVIGAGAVAGIFFGSIIAVIVVFSVISKRSKCPRCGAVIRRDNLSSEGYFQYTCPQCRIVWQSSIRGGGPAGE